MTKSYVYRLYDTHGQLLYVGKADNVGDRLDQHRQGRGWWSEVAYATQEAFGSPFDAYQAEDRAIVLERPKYNLTGTVYGMIPEDRLRRHGFRSVDVTKVNRIKINPETAPGRSTSDGSRVAYSMSEAAKALGVTRQFLSNLEKNGQLKVVRLGRRVLIPVLEIDRLMGLT